jgi:hypothetical protein
MAGSKVMSFLPIDTGMVAAAASPAPARRTVVGTSMVFCWAVFQD